MPKKDTIGRRLARGITKAQTFSEKHIAPRYKALESQFYWVEEVTSSVKELERITKKRRRN